MFFLKTNAALINLRQTSLVLIWTIVDIFNLLHNRLLPFVTKSQPHNQEKIFLFQKEKKDQ